MVAVEPAVVESLSWFLTAISSLGAAGGPIFAVLWWMERRERQEAQKVAKELLLQTLASSSAMTAGVLAVRESQVELREAQKDATNMLASAIRSIKRVAG